MYAKTLSLLVFFNLTCSMFLYAQNFDDSKRRIESYLDKLKENKYFEAEEDSFSRSILPDITFLFISSSKLKNGKVFTYYTDIYGTPFLYDDALNGNVVIHGKLYNLRLLYDIYMDNLICSVGNLNGNKAPIILNKLLIESFSLNEKHFINYKDKGLNGFYELIYDGGEFKLLAKWRKKSAVDVNQNRTKKFTKIKKQLYLVNDSASVQIRNKKAFINFFKLNKFDAKLKRKHPIKNLTAASNHELIDFAKSFE